MIINDLVGKKCPLTKLPSTFPTEIDESLALGLDLGIGSCGQALITDKGHAKYKIHDIPAFPARINFLGVRAFDVPETREKTGVKLLNPERRNKRHLRTTTRRRAARMWQIRRLLKHHGILPDDYPTDENLWKHSEKGTNQNLDKWRDWHSRMTSGKKGSDGPWLWRVKSLDEKLEALELAAVLLHLAKHRGFRSNRKSENSDDEGGKVIVALRENESRMVEKNYRTIGEMFLKDPEFAEKKRNTSGSYTATIKRKDQEKEIQLIFRNQRELGSLLATQKIESDFLELFNKQLPLQNPVKLLGDCPFETGEKRGSRLSPSFELCRSLQKLNVLSLILDDGKKTRLADYVDARNGGYRGFINQFSAYTGTKSNPGRITWKDLRKVFEISPCISFADLPAPGKKKVTGVETLQSTEQLEGEDFLTRSTANSAAKGSYLLRKAIGDKLWCQIQEQTPEQLDQAAFALTFFEEIENSYDTQEFWGVLNQMKHDKLEPSLIDAIKKDLNSDSPTLHKFSDTSSMSTISSRKLLPLLEKGVIYSKACSSLYTDHRQSDFSFESITNPVVKSVVQECLKQVIHLIDETGKIPGRICVELSRELGKSISARNEMQQGIAKRTTSKNAHRDNLAEELGRNPDPNELLRYELWLEQANTCPYCGIALSGNLEEVAHSQKFEIDHILPRSRSHDNSYDNKVLAHTHCNQHKANQTPFEFREIGNNDENSPGWLAFTTCINAMRGIRKHKRRLLLNITFADNENHFAARHLINTSYISKLVTHYLQEIYAIVGEKRLAEKGSKRRVFVQPGQLTSLVRKAWGLESLKKDREGNRLGDKHHAVDALICALLSEGQRQFITVREQQKRDEDKLRLSAPTSITELSRSYELMETKNDHCGTPRNVSPPWKNFRHDVVEALDVFTVSRRENRKGRGSLHIDTLYSECEENESKIIYARKPLVTQINGKTKASLTLNQFENIRGINDQRNQWLRETLTTWLEKGAPVSSDELPRDPQGNVIKRVYLNQGKKSGRHYPQGFVTGGDQIRLDVFSKTKPDGSKTFFLVPVYSYHLASESAPNKAIVAGKDEENWDEMTEDHTYEFSLWKNSRVEIKKKTSKKKPAGEHFVGLYKGTNRSTGSFMLANPEDSAEQLQFTAKTGTLVFRKIETDRLGREYLVKKEKRTWRGKNIT